jgi:hypothetical protein
MSSLNIQMAQHATPAAFILATGVHTRDTPSVLERHHAMLDHVFNGRSPLAERRLAAVAGAQSRIGAV